MVTKKKNELLTRVEGHAPMGRLMRENYWIPACLSSQLVADDAPLRVRLLGTDYVAFRATDGRVGFLDERCPHRGVSLALARNEDCGLRCIFHGWKIDVSGKVVDVPTHSPNPEKFAARVKVGHYPSHEGGGIVWVWLGAQPAPRFPELAFTSLPQRRVWMTITKMDCNWLQGIEATIDSAHIGTLHAAYMAPARDRGERDGAFSMANLAPKYEVKRQPYGLDAVAHRPQADGTDYLRTTCYIVPYVSLTPFSEEVPGVAFIVSPIDDTHCNLFYGIWSPSLDIDDGGGIPGVLASAKGTLPYDPHNYAPLTGGRDANYGQDRMAMKQGHFSGFVGGLLQEDVAAQGSMGPIVDRSLDHMSSSDVAIAQARLLLLAALDDMAAGRVPVGAGAELDFSEVVPTTIVTRSEQ